MQRPDEDEAWRKMRLALQTLTASGSRGLWEAGAA